MRIQQIVLHLILIICERVNLLINLTKFRSFLFLDGYGICSLLSCQPG